MKQKIQSILKKSSYWAGVILLGTILGVSLQFTRAWVEPDVAPPGGNIGAPINTGPVTQFKQGAFGIGNSTTNGVPMLSFTTGGASTGIGVTQHNIFGPWDSPSGDAGALYIGTGRSADKAEDNRNNIVLYNYGCTGGDCNVPNIYLYADHTHMMGTASVDDIYIRSIGKWASELGGAPAPPAPVITYLVNGSHNTDQCVIVGGTAFETGSGKVCKLAGTSCPSGWNQYGGWSTTIAKSCSRGTCGATVSSGSHAFSDNNTTEFVSYTTLNVQSGMCNTNNNCIATKTEIGCY